MAGEPIIARDEAPTLTLAIGTIEPAPRVASGDIEAAKVGDLAERLTGDEFFTETPESTPSACVDGRSEADGTSANTLNAAGGTFSAVVGDILTTGTYLRSGSDTAATHAIAVYSFLRQAGYAVGGHDADHATGEGCGCGAEDKFKDLLDFIHAEGAAVRDVVGGIASALGIDIPDELHDHIVSRAGLLSTSGYVSTGSQLRAAFVDATGDKNAVRTLTGPHNEVVLVVNLDAGVTLDRARIRAEFGDKYQAFNVDVPALQAAAKALSLTPEEANAKLIAMLYYNVATAAVLGGKSMRVVVHHSASRAA